MGAAFSLLITVHWWKLLRCFRVADRLLAAAGGVAADDSDLAGQFAADAAPGSSFPLHHTRILKRKKQLLVNVGQTICACMGEKQRC